MSEEKSFRERTAELRAMYPPILVEVEPTPDEPIAISFKKLLDSYIYKEVSRQTYTQMRHDLDGIFEQWGMSNIRYSIVTSDDGKCAELKGLDTLSEYAIKGIVAEIEALENDNDG